MSDFSYAAVRTDSLPETIAERTRRVYDRMAVFYPASTFFFHSRAHRCALEVSGIEDGMRVLEVATGSGEMFRRLVKANRSGHTVGFDLSPNMAARTQRRVRTQYPGVRTHCQAVDARYMPFPDETFDAVVCCYLLELLSSEDIMRTLHEFRRVLRAGRKLTLVCIGQNTDLFNRAYRICGRVAPAFWGRQVESRVPDFLDANRMHLIEDRKLRQGFYPSRVLVAKK